jgi:crotonobetainyl-CoA:carnitine CoA-transferase CaiB-like acyl-CoA transferase
MAHALSGLRVVELADSRSVAYCGVQFATWGADVVRLEPSQGVGFGAAKAPIAQGRTPASLEWQFLNSSKRVRIQPADASSDDVRALLLDADVFITDWANDRLVAAGLSFHDLSQTSPQLVMLSFSDFGNFGPYSRFQATDLILQALTAYMWVNGEAGKPPLKAPANIVPYACGLSSFIGTLAALRARRTTGVGQLVEVAAMEAISSLVQHMRTQYFGSPPQRAGGVGPPMLPCKDGYLYFNYLLEWSREPLLLTLGIENDVIPEEPEEVFAFLASRTKDRRATELRRELAELGANCSIVQDLQQVLRDEHLQSKNYFLPVSSPDGELLYPGPPARMTLTPAIGPRTPTAFDGWREPAGHVRPSKAVGPARPPLDGLRVLDLTQAWIGPYAAMLLADLGADVIKIESPTRPDVWRNVSEVPPCARPHAHRWNTCHYFNSVNRNKRSLTLDLNAPRGKALFLTLVETADVLMENYTPRVMQNFGLGYDVLKEVNPQLIMASFSGYGKTGPYRDTKATGASIEPIAGWSSLFGYGGGRPMTMGEYQLDPLGGLHMAAASLVALSARDGMGSGQAIEGSMFEVAVGYIGEQILLAQATGELPKANGNRDLKMAPHGVFRCAGSDEWVAIAVRDDQDWLRLGSVIAGAALEDERFCDSAGRLLFVDEVEEVVSRWTRGRSALQAMTELQAAGVPGGLVQRTDQAIEDPHLAARDWFKVMNHPDLGPHKYYGFPWAFSGSRLVAHMPPPRLGEHSHEILRANLGLDNEEISALEDAGVTGQVFTDGEGPANERPARRRPRQL